ncbi:MAG: Flp family type IVb pilin [Proteobacteria bacterium]|nr:Flp family type IVb pilin [Pseudomonadota bacterium]
MGRLPLLSRDDSGATAIEYGLLAALVSVAAIVLLQLLGVSLSGLFDIVSAELDASLRRCVEVDSNCAKK